MLSRTHLFTDTTAILNSVVSNSYYGMLRGQISVYFHKYSCSSAISTFNRRNRITNGGYKHYP